MSSGAPYETKRFTNYTNSTKILVLCSVLVAAAPVFWLKKNNRVPGLEKRLKIVDTWCSVWSPDAHMYCVETYLVQFAICCVIIVIIITVIST